MNVGLSVLLYGNKFGSSNISSMSNQTRNQIRESILDYVCVIYRTKMSWKFTSIHPGIYWNILESHFFIAVRTLM